MSFDAKWDRGTHETRIAQQENVQLARKRHNGTLDYAAYSHANSKNFQGFQGSLFLGRNYGNDSSNVAFIFNPIEYCLDFVLFFVWGVCGELWILCVLHCSFVAAVEKF